MQLDEYDKASENASNETDYAADEGSGRDTLIFWCISVFYCCVNFIGVFGNSLVIFAVLGNRKLRGCCTNILILNIAVADLIVMLIGVAEISREFLEQGWIFGLVLCKMQRHMLTSAIYASVLTMVVLSIERYMVIVHAVKSRMQLMFTVRMATVAISVIWPISFLCASPTLIWNTVILDPNLGLLACRQMIPMLLYYRTAECVIFYITPLCIQAVLYIIVSKHLFHSIKGLQLNAGVEPVSGEINSGQNLRNSGKNYDENKLKQLNLTAEEKTKKEKDTNNLRAPLAKAANGGNHAKVQAIETRKQVVRMLIVCVALYAAAYSPTLFNTCLSLVIPDQVMHVIEIFSMCVVYINHAGNPIIYAIFSTQFRHAFKSTCFSICISRKSRLHRREKNGLLTFASNY